MPTVITKTVRAAGQGGDYTSLSAFEAGEQKDLVAADEIVRAECGNFKDVTFCSFRSWGTDATHYPEVVALDDHESTGGITTKAYRLVRSGTGMEVDNQNIRLVGIQVRSGKAIQFKTLITGDIGTAENCIFIASGFTAAVHLTLFPGGRVRLINCLLSTESFPLNNALGAEPTFSGNFIDMYSCTLVGSAAVSSNITATFKNCYAFTYEGTGSPTLINCASSDNTGTSGFQNIARDFTNFVNPSGDENLSAFENIENPIDWRLTQGSLLRGSGIDTSAESAPFDFTDDLRGRSRLRDDKGWDIGCYKYVAPNVFFFGL